MNTINYLIAAIAFSVLATGCQTNSAEIEATSSSLKQYVDCAKCLSTACPSTNPEVKSSGFCDCMAASRCTSQCSGAKTAYCGTKPPPSSSGGEIACLTGLAFAGTEFGANSFEAGCIFLGLTLPAICKDVKDSLAVFSRSYGNDTKTCFGLPPAS